MYAPQLTTQITVDQLDRAGMDHSTFQRTKYCLYIVLALIPIAGMGYIATSDKMIAAGILGIPVAFLCVVHAPFSLIVLYFFLPVEGAIQISPYFTISKGVGIIVLLSFIPRAIGRPLILPPPIKFVFLLGIWAIMSLVWAASPIYTATGLIGLTLNIGLMVILVNTIQDKAHFNLILLSLFMGAIVASSLVTFGHVSYANNQEDMGRVVLSEGTNPNILAAAILFGLLSGFYLFLHWSWFRRIFLLAAFPIMLFAILQTQSRTVLITTVVAPIVGFAMSLRGSKKIHHILGILGVCVVAYLLYYVILNTSILSNDARDRFLASGNNLQASGRTEMWMRGVRFFLSSPILGSGWRNFAVRAGLHSSVSSAHNNMIAMAVELGIVGFGLMTLFFVYLFVGSLRCPDPRLRWIGLTFIAFNLLVGTTSTTLMQKDFWYSLSFVLLTTELGRKQRQHIQQPSALPFQQFPGYSLQPQFSGMPQFNRHGPPGR